jgi:hypothetical protein
MVRGGAEGVAGGYFCPFCCVVDPDSHGFWSDGSGFSRAKLCHRNRNNEGISYFMFSSAGFRFSSFLIKIINNLKKISAVKLYKVFGIKTLDSELDPDMDP